MKHIKITLAIFTMLLIGISSINAQSFGNRIGNAVKRSAENTAVRKAEQKTEQAVGKAIDKATDPDTYENKDNGNSQQQQNSNTQQQQTQQSNTSNQNSGAGNDASSQGSDTQTTQQAANTPKTIEMTYAKSDFVSGDEIFFEDDLANEKLGEFPSLWDLERGNAEVASINGVKCINLIGYTIINPLMTEKNYLPDEFTIEYDIYVDAPSSGYVECEIGFNDSRTFVGRHYISKSIFRLDASWKKPDDSGGSQNEDIAIKENEWNHVSISFNKRAMKYYVNGVRYLNVPNMKKPTSIWLWAYDGKAYYKNIRFAKGAVPLYDRMMTDGKFITYGITFDIGKSTIKPESMGEINRIITMMTENADLKFSVEGHTDNTGNAAANQTLSEARSKAIVDKLVENGITANRLTSAGKGQNTPISDNSTDEGRAKNRRVEFVKL